MGNLISEKYTASQHKSNLRNIAGPLPPRA